ncbi:MAG: tRNA (N6-threonylcarbamoyladenosine(37)-N6)-methyltransferase TrmO [candidate division Zixibacteria bacterium]|nr:tRNA (N6-threonylcarbamoyladenosine(37)-N6)-methyltransferase TrmO [candidate division Zixibacteria bacterium]
MDDIIFRPIGIIHTPYSEPKGVPIQPNRGKDVEATIEIFDEYVEGLADLDGFSHIILLFHLHKSTGYKMKVVPFLDDTVRGLFSTRAPRRPNPIGLSIVRLTSIERNILHIKDIDIVDGTPLLDIKPHVPNFDESENFRIGWLEDKVKRPSARKNADDRFEE